MQFNETEILRRISKSAGFDIFVVFFGAFFLFVVLLGCM